VENACWGGTIQYRDPEAPISPWFAILLLLLLLSLVLQARENRSTHKHLRSKTMTIKYFQKEGGVNIHYDCEKSLELRANLGRMVKAL
jgi:uncharacterized membrane protein